MALLISSDFIPIMRQSAQRYVPPSRRGLAAGTDTAELRGLEGAAPDRVSLVRLVVPDGVTFDLAACPLDIEPAQPEGGTAPAHTSGAAAPPAAASANATGPGDAPSTSGAAYVIYHPDRLPSELLRWLSATFPDSEARLEFPPSLSKAERARWHHAAERARLHGQSAGVGEGRYLTIGTAPSRRSGGAGAGARAQLTREQAEYARRVYDAAQMEGGKHWERSRGEIEALVASGQPLPEDLQALVDKRLAGDEALRLLKEGRPSEALALLAEDPKLAWVKDAASGGYPIHIAAWKGYESVVLYLASLANVLEQRDGRRETALAVARRFRQAGVEALLLEAGANPEHASYAQEGPASGDPDGRPGGGHGQEAEDYCSWSAEEQLRYRHGGSGPPPGLHARGRGRGGPGGRGRGGPPASRGSPARGEQQERQGCPW